MTGGKSGRRSRAIAALPALWRRVLFSLDLKEDTAEKTSIILGIREAEVRWIAEAARAHIREKMQEFGYTADNAATLREPSRIPQPLQDRDRIESALLGDMQGEPS